MEIARTTTRRGSSGAGDIPAFDCSHCVRLSGGEWFVVAAVVLCLIRFGPALWNRVEGFQPGSDYRIPYELSSDYWLYRRLCSRACAQEKILVVGDSVVWGHYVPPEQTLSHYLNEFSGREQFANLGLDGTHPAALEGLLTHYGAGLSGRTVLLHLNPLWMSSSKHDLQTTKEFHFNHQELVAQFTPQIPCYKAPFAQRLRIAIQRKIPFCNWTSHLRTAYCQSKDLQTWTLEHPYSNPLGAMLRGLPESQGPGEAPSGSWLDKGGKKQDLAWVELEGSVQWRFFRRALERLKHRNDKVFVLVGPFNEHMLTPANAARYNALKDRVAIWLRANGVPCFVPPPLPAAQYVDASHPIGAGYALLAKQLLEQSSFTALVTSQDAKGQP
jgi:hypothetical protein